MRQSAAVALALGAVTFVTGLAAAQRFETKRPLTVVVGTPRAHAATDRVDGQRSGRATSRLPRGPLTIAWRRPLAFSSDRAPLVTRDGEIVVVDAQGTVVTLGDDGVERGRVPTGLPATSAAALLSDGTVVFVAASGVAVGVRGGAVRFRTRITEARVVSSRVAPLPLADGGVAVAAGLELVALDAEGAPRARRTLTEPAAAPLVDARGMVVVVAAGGAVYGWTPDREVQRLGAFGGPVDDAAAFDGDRTLLAVVAGRQLAALDLVRGTASPRSLPSLGLYLGPPALDQEGTAHLFLHGPTSTTVVAIRRDGVELGLARAATYVAQLAPDGGAAALVAPGHVGPLVDAAGTVAYASPHGWVGVVSGCDRSGDGASGCVVNTAGEAPCIRSATAGLRSSGGIAGLAPAGDGAFVVACDGGSVVKVTSR